MILQTNASPVIAQHSVHTGPTCLTDARTTDQAPLRLNDECQPVAGGRWYIKAVCVDLDAMDVYGRYIS